MLRKPTVHISDPIKLNGPSEMMQIETKHTHTKNLIRSIFMKYGELRIVLTVLLPAREILDTEP